MTNKESYWTCAWCNCDNEIEEHKLRKDVRLECPFCKRHSEVFHIQIFANTKQINTNK